MGEEGARRPHQEGVAPGRVQSMTLDDPKEKEECRDKASEVSNAKPDEEPKGGAGCR